MCGNSRGCPTSRDNNHYPPPFPTVHHPMAHPPHSLDCVYMYSTVIFHDTMQLASKDSTAVITVRMYVHVCGHLAYVSGQYV